MLEVKDVLPKKNNANLKKRFQESKKDPLFQSVVDELKISEEILEKNTSRIEDAVKEIKNCNNCGSLSSCKNLVKGYCNRPGIIDGVLSFDYIACQYMQKYLNTTEFYKNIYLFDIPKDIQLADVKKIYKDDKERTETIKYLKKFYDNYFHVKEKGLYLYGNFGCGKTYLIAAFFNELAKKNIQSAIIYYPEFLRSLKESFGDGNEFRDKYEYIKKVPILLLDDIGAENVTAWSRDEILGPLLQYRMQEDLPTFFTSNLNIDELEEHYSTTNNSVDKIKAKRVVERIKSLTNFIKLIGENRRK